MDQDRSVKMSTMQAANRLWQALKKGGPTFGAWQMLPGSNNSRAMARTGIDWIVVDTEHGNVDDGQMHEAVAAIAACGVSPVVRIAANEGWMVKRALDSGAHGIVVPLIYTPADVSRLVASAKFPPRGNRGFGSPFPMEKFDPSLTTAEYLQQANDALITIVQIETKEALENVDAIAAIDGVDVLLVGPFDLGNNIGYPILDGTMHTYLVRAIDRILEAATKHGKRTGIYCTSGEQSRHFAEKGFNMVSIAADMIALPAYLTSTLKIAKGESGAAEKVTGPYGR
ncbi:uncharacterized protein PV09_02447 [Verruconis gallopava]|uniref:HpcH/HpaI aldolase/citrate lyase domain-containing protein n=1 Tax=Verruconis gallopava TaxID=253628 RepID=A0A0D1Z1D6_9PEZI|nr:uncharacterized protein PV09_02447 [Verruconis gallopava]KIW06757.1 hypothetical protein PV09_02447 [Verruconis gallopava]